MNTTTLGGIRLNCFVNFWKNLQLEDQSVPDIDSELWQDKIYQLRDMLKLATEDQLIYLAEVHHELSDLIDLEIEAREEAWFSANMPDDEPATQPPPTSFPASW